jgi:hypothetical protein
MWADALSFVGQAYWGIPTYQAFPAVGAACQLVISWYVLFAISLNSFYTEKEN